MKSEVFVDCSISYLVTNEEMNNLYIGFDELSEEEQYDIVIDYVKTKLFKKKDLMYNCDDFED